MATKINTPPRQAWVQVTDDALNCTENGATMVRTYKLPTENCRNILTYLKIGMTPSAVESWMGGMVGGLDDGGVEGSDFVPSEGETFYLASYSLQQIEAGQYMVLKCRYEYSFIDIETLPEDPTETWQEEVSETWSVNWTTYSVSPYIYCNEVDHVDTYVAEGATPPQPSTEIKAAKRRHIEMALTQNAQDSDNNPYLWMNANGQYLLTDDEVKIWKKVATGVNPVFHKPIVTKTSVWKSNKKHNLPDPSGNIDQIGLPGGAIAQGWNGTFIYCGMSYTESQQTITTIVVDPETQRPTGETKTITIYTLTCVDTWEGALKPDLDFYGTDPWEFGVGPSRQES